MRSRLDKAKSMKIISELVKKESNQRQRKNADQRISISSTSSKLQTDSFLGNVDGIVQKEQESTKDPFGSHVTHLLNQGAFLKIDEMRNKDKIKTDSIFPLMSVSNMQKLKSIILKAMAVIHEPIKAGKDGAWRSMLGKAFAVVFLMFIPTVSIFLALAISTIIRLYLFISLSILALLVNVEDIYSLLPKSTRQSVDKITFYLKDFDRKFFYSEALVGREQWEASNNTLPLEDRNIPSALISASNQYDENQENNQKSKFQHVDWNVVSKSFSNKDEFNKKTVDHLVAMNFAFAMTNGSHIEEKSKKKQKKDAKAKSTRNLENSNNNDELVKKNSSDVVEPSIIEPSSNLAGSDVQTISLSSGVEMIRETPMKPRPIQRQKSSSRRANIFSYDDSEYLVQPNDDQIAQRQRILSETDLDFYYGEDDESNDEGSIDGEADQKNKKWLDVGARIGMRLLKSEQVQDLITQTNAKSNDTADSEFDIEENSIGEGPDLIDMDEFNENIPKPVHAMWQTADGGSCDEYSLSDSEESSPNTPRKFRKSLHSPRITPRAKKGILSPSRSPRLKGLPLPLDSNHSMPSSILDEKPSIHFHDKKFDANQFLPASMTIKHDLPKPSVKSGGKNRSFNKSRRDPLLQGVKVIVPLIPSDSSKKGRVHQLGTVVSSKRIFIGSGEKYNDVTTTNAIEICVKLDKSFLRNGRFVEMTMRALDDSRYFPRHSKYPIGATVATSFGVGILVGWRPKDDTHIIRSLWQKRGNGSSHAYLNRNSLHGILEAAIGFKVNTSFGPGKIVAYVNAGNKFLDGQFVVKLKHDDVLKRVDKELKYMQRNEINDCTSAKFIPVLEQLKEAAKYKMQVDTYETAKFQMMIEDKNLLLDKTWRMFSEGFELFLTSFIKAAEENEDFDVEINNFLSKIINFLEDFELDGAKHRLKQTLMTPTQFQTNIQNNVLDTNTKEDNVDAPGLWFIHELFNENRSKEELHEYNNKRHRIDATKSLDSGWSGDSYKKIYAVLNMLMRTISIAKAGCINRPNLKMALAIIHETLVFIHNVIKVQQVNMTEESVKEWKDALEEFGVIFGPANARMQKIGNGILKRLEDHGRIAKVRALAFLELLVSDDKLIESLETGDVDDCVTRVENAAVTAEIINEDMRKQYHKIGLLIYQTMAPRFANNNEAALRNGQKFTLVAKAIKLMATPARSALSLLTNDEILELIERLFLRVFEKDEEAVQVINIYSWSFRTLRHLRILVNIAIVGTLWAPILDAADDEFAWAVSRYPEQTKEYIRPVSKLFSLGVARFHEIHQSDSSVSLDWLDFLKEDEAIAIVQELDKALLQFLKRFCKDVKEMMYVLPYYSSIDDDILNLIDEVDPEREINEIAEALAEPSKFPEFVRRKSAKAIAKFLDYLPKMSIPVERREINESWVITCRGRNGKDLTLSNIGLEQDNIFCKVFGSQNVFGLDDIELQKRQSMDSVMKESTFNSDEGGNIEISILDHVAELIRNAQRHDCWVVDDVDDGYFASGILSSSSLNGLPLSKVLRCSIDLWENMQIDDDELLEIAIREISYQIQVQKAKEEEEEVDEEIEWLVERHRILELHESYSSSKGFSFDVDIINTFSMEGNEPGKGRRFDPKNDPTIFFLGINQLTCSLENFTYRLEPAEINSVFDPVFEGVGDLAIRNASIKIRIECKKGPIEKMGEEVYVPRLCLKELEIGLEKVKFQFKETGADWVLNKLVSNFSDKITMIVRENIQSAMALSIENALDTMNKYIEVNPDPLIKILGIDIDDLEENVAWV